MKKVLMIMSVACLAANARSQDQHFSQVAANSGVIFNLPSVMNQSEIYANLTFRSQWRSGLGNGFNTSVADVQGSFFEKKLNAGLYLVSDKSGDGRLNMLQVDLPVSTSLKVSRYSALTIGIGLGWLQHSVQTAQFTWASQYNGSVIDNSLDPGENFAALKKSAFDLSCAALLSTRTDDHVIDIAVGVAHLNKPNLSFFEDPAAFVHHKVSALAHYGILRNKLPWLNFSHLFFLQNAQMENYTCIEYTVNKGKDSWYTGFNKSSRYGFMAGVRWGDSFVAGGFFDFQTTYRIGFTCDFALLGPSRTNSAWGGPEITLTYHPAPKRSTTKRFF